MKTPLMRLIFVALILVLASLACNMPTNSPARPTLEPTLSTEDIQNIEESLKATLAASNQSNEITIAVNQQQLNSFLLAELARQPDLPLTDPQVVLTNNQMEVFGKVTQSGIVLETKTVLKPRVDENGVFKLDVVSIDLGPFPAPDSIKNQIGALVDNTLHDFLAAKGGNLTVTSISITEGVLTVFGNRNQP